MLEGSYGAADRGGKVIQEWFARCSGRVAMLYSPCAEMDNQHMRFVVPCGANERG
jgi:hypothetical protein